MSIDNLKMCDDYLPVTPRPLCKKTIEVISVVDILENICPECALDSGLVSKNQQGAIHKGRPAKSRIFRPPSPCLLIKQ